MAKKKRSKSKKVFYTTAILAPVFALACLVFTAYLGRELEAGMLDVYSIQQDAYVELVLDQINLKENRDDAEIVSQILNTLDASSNKYWTFSAEQTMLFVKDVMETNKYKGVTTATYYVSDSARQFIEGLQLNRVTHATIEIEGREYIASGVVFTYQGMVYNLCLLTNRDVLMDSNEYLGAKTQLWIVFLCVLLALIVVPFCLALRLAYAQEREEAYKRDLRVMGLRLTELNDQLVQQEMYDAKKNLWQENMLPRFLEALKKRGTVPVTFIRVHCDDAKTRKQFISLGQYTLNSSCLRVALKDYDLFLIFVGMGEDAAVLSVIPCLSLTSRIVAKETVEKPGEAAFDAAARRVLQEREQPI